MLTNTWIEITRLSEHIKTVPVGTDEYNQILHELKTLVEIQDLISPSYRGEINSELNKITIALVIIGSVGMASAVFIALNKQAKKPLTLKFQNPNTIQ